MSEYAHVIIALPIIVYSIILHEIAHGWVAERFGDRTARLSGRITLNPVPHIDPFMTIALPVMLYFLTQGRAIFGGARPVPINPLNLRRKRLASALLTAAGPGMNIAVAFFFAILLNVRILVPLDSLLYQAFIIVVLMNVFLASFNLLPIPPLDGSHILAAIFPNTIGKLFSKIDPRFSIMILMVFIWAPGLSDVTFFVVKKIAYFILLGIALLLGN